MSVTALMSAESCLSMGDALREIEAKSLIRNDFILITGDLVSNMDISQVVKEHKYVQMFLYVTSKSVLC